MYQQPQIGPRHLRGFHRVGTKGCTPFRAWLRFLVCAALCFALSAARGGTLDEMPLEQWQQLREAERYQMKIAEEYYRKGDYNAALTEYEKFLSLYEKSAGAPYAQLKWSLCQVQRKRLHTAIKDGFQSVIDYWPESAQARASAYFIARTLRDMGETKRAKKAYADVLTKQPSDVAAALARYDLAEMARLENDAPRRLALLRELTFDTKRQAEAVPICVQASRELAAHYFGAGAFAEGRQALETTYQGADLPPQVVSLASGAIVSLCGADATKARGTTLADQLIAFLREQLPADVSKPEEKARARQYWFYMADAYIWSQRAGEVPKVYEQLARALGNDDATRGRLAAWFKSQGQRDQARAVYRQFDDKLAGEGQVAYSFREEKRYDEAIAVYRQLVAADQKNPHQWSDAVGQSYIEAGKCDEAVAVYRQLLTDNAARADDWLWRIAHCYRHFGRYKEAIAAFRQCDAQFPEQLKQMAWCHRQLKEWNEAVVLYNQLRAAHEPSAPWATLEIANTYEQADQKEKAIAWFKTVCAKYPKSGEASNAHAHLQTKYMINATLGGATEGEK